MRSTPAPTMARSLRPAVSPDRRYDSAGCGAPRVRDGSRRGGQPVGPVTRPTAGHAPAKLRSAVLVRLAGGPYDGARDMPFAGEILKYEADSPPSESSGPVPLLAWYVPSQDDANVYVFAGVERDAWRMHTGLLLPPGGAQAKKPRVYELAAEFGSRARSSWTSLRRWANSSVRRPRLLSTLLRYKLRQDFAAQAQRKPRSSG